MRCASFGEGVWCMVAQHNPSATRPDAKRCPFNFGVRVDGFEDELELLVMVGVFFLQGFDFLGEEGVGVHQPPELDEGAHDGDVHLDSTPGAQDAGKHGHALLGEGIGKVGVPTVFPGTHHRL